MITMVMMTMIIDVMLKKHLLEVQSMVQCSCSPLVKYVRNSVKCIIFVNLIYK